MTNALDLEALYTVYAENGEPIAYAAHLSEYMESIGTRYWYAGSASGPVTGHYTRLEVGFRFRHWDFGLCEVEKINRKTIRLAVLDAASECKMSERILNV